MQLSPVKRPRLVAALMAVLVLGAACVESTPGDGSVSSSTTTTAAISAGSATIGFEGTSFAATDCSYGGLIRSIEAIDELTVKFTLCEADVHFLSKVAHPAFGILPSDYLESTGGGLALVQTPIGSGPYLLDRWDSGTQILLAANSNYWGGQAATDSVVVRWTAEAGERLSELKSGAVDAISDLSGDDFEDVEADTELLLLQPNPVNTAYLGMNRDRAPLSDLAVRKAIAQAIDLEHLVDDYFPLGSEAATQILPRAVSGFASEVVSYELDAEIARGLLLDAGFEDGIELVLSYGDTSTVYLPDPLGVAEEIQRHLGVIGVTVTLEALDLATLQQRAALGELDLFLSGMKPNPPDANNFLGSQFGIDASMRFGEHIPELEDLLSEAALTIDLTLRRELYQQAAELIKSQVPLVPLAHSATAAAWSNTTSGANTSPLAVEDFSQVTVEGREAFVWMQATEPAGLYCADETSDDATRICVQIVESLLSYQVGGQGVEPSLATSWQSNSSFTEWTFALRPDVLFHDGTSLDANDVVLSFVVQWDRTHPLRSGRTGQFTKFIEFFGAFTDGV